MSSRPLSGIRIVDLTHVWAGPLGTRILGDLGADVVKVEAPLARGPASRLPRGTPLWVGGPDGPARDADDHWNWQALTSKLNRAKRGLCIDLKSAPGIATLLELIRCADVVIENFSANAMRSLGLDYRRLKAANPTIVYVSMPGFGSWGPYSARTAFGPSVEPMTGLGALLGYQPDEPRNTAMALVDAIGGVSAAAAVMTALSRRQATGEGAHVEVSLHEAGVSFFGEFLADHQLGHPHESIGNAHPRYAPHGVYPTLGEDAWIAIACPDQQSWANLKQATAGLWDGDAGLDDPEARLASRKLLDDKLAAWTRGQDKHSLTRLLQQAGVPAGPVSTAPEFMADPHLAARGYWVDQALAGQPQVRYPGLAISLNGDNPPHGRPAPKFGEHNREVLREWLGKDDQAIEALLASGALLDQPPDLS